MQLKIKEKYSQLEKKGEKIFLNDTVNFRFTSDFKLFKAGDVTNTHRINAEVYADAKLGEIVKDKK